LAREAHNDRRWVGSSALDRVLASIPGALPQAGMNRTFGPPEMVRIVSPHLKMKTKDPMASIVSSDLEV
jgi:hypothetical protein